VQQFVDSWAQHFVVCGFSTIFFLSYYFLEFDKFNFSFHDTYNNRLKERYTDDLSTFLNLNPNLWLEARSSDWPDINRVYGLSNSTTENLWMAGSASTIECSQFITSTQTLEFEMMLDQWVQARTTHLNEKCGRLTVNYEELRQLAMKMRSQLGGTCAPPNWSHNPNDDQPLLLALPLF
jgi:hypothetical protein